MILIKALSTVVYQAGSVCVYGTYVNLTHQGHALINDVTFAMHLCLQVPKLCILLLRVYNRGIGGE